MDRRRRHRQHQHQHRHQQRHAMCIVDTVAATLKSNDSRFSWVLLLAMPAPGCQYLWRCHFCCCCLLSAIGVGCAPQVLQFIWLRHASCGGSLIASRRLLPFGRSPTTIMCKSSSSNKNELTKAKSKRNKKKKIKIAKAFAHKNWMRL